MRITKIIIKNILGISEKQLDEKSVELTGKNGSGKTSVLDAIRYALTNSSNRDYIIKAGAEEGEILIETDSPYLAPVPYRGKTNEPAFVVKTAEKIAAIKGLTIEETARITTDNFFKLYRKAKR